MKTAVKRKFGEKGSLYPSNPSGLMDYIDTERLMLVWNCASSTEISVGCFSLPLESIFQSQILPLPFCSNLDEA